MSKDPVFLTDKNHTVILEAVTGVPNAAVPDTCNPFELLTPNTSEGPQKSICRWCKSTAGTLQ